MFRKPQYNKKNLYNQIHQFKNLFKLNFLWYILKNDDLFCYTSFVMVGYRFSDSHFLTMLFEFSICQMQGVVLYDRKGNNSIVNAKGI